MKFNKYDDPGHGWLKVTRKLIMKLGIENKISNFSYMRGDFVYLEEDCDLSLFLKKMEDFGISVEIKTSYGNKSSKIRGYDSYRSYTQQEIDKIKDLRKRMLNNMGSLNKKAIRHIKNVPLSSLVS